MNRPASANVAWGAEGLWGFFIKGKGRESPSAEATNIKNQILNLEHDGYGEKTKPARSQIANCEKRRPAFASAKRKPSSRSRAKGVQGRDRAIRQRPGGGGPSISWSMTRGKPAGAVADVARRFSRCSIAQSAMAEKRAWAAT